MKKLICILLSGIFVFGICGTFSKLTNAAETDGNIDAFAKKVSEMVSDYGTVTQVETFAENDALHEYETCRLIVKSEEKIDTLNAVSVISGYRNLWILQFENSDDTAEAYKYYANLAEIEYVTPDKIVTMQSADEFTEEQKIWPGEMTRTTEVTEYLETQNSEEVTVGIIDSGLDYNNDIFEGRLVDKGVNLIEPNENTAMSDDPKSHGTHIAGIIAMNTPDTAKLRAYKIFDFKGNSTELLVITAIDLAVSDGMDIINLSLGTADSYALRESLQNAYDSGTVIVTASGNQGINCSDTLPAAFDGAITVGAVDKDGTPADFSNFGATLDIVAPGVGIYSCLNGNKYGLISGTSMATPFVSSAAAILLGSNPDLAPSEVETLLKENAHPVKGSYPKNKIGDGILNIAQAIECPRAEGSELIVTNEDGYGEITVSFSEAENTAIYYTLNGDYPTKENGTLYESPFEITESAPITWRSFSDDSSLFASKAQTETIRVFETPDESDFTVDSDGVLTDYSGSENSVIVPETVGGITVVAVGAGAFEDTKASFSEIIFPDTVKSIGTKAFRLNKSIRYVKGEGLEAIGESAFSGCSSLVSVDAPSVKTVSGYAFNRCTLLSDFNSSDVTEIGEYAFANAENITVLSLEKLENIGMNAFEKSGLRSFDAPVLKAVSKAAFSECPSLADINIECAETIEAQAFSGCKNLRKLYLPNVITVESQAFSGSNIGYIRFDNLEKCDAHFTSDCTVILPLTAASLGFDSDYIVNRVHLKIYSAPGTYAEEWAKSRHSNCTSEFIALPAIEASFPEYITNETELSVDAVGFNLTYQWYGSTDGTQNTLVMLDGETEKCFNITGDKNYVGYFCKVTSTENGISHSATKGAVYAHLLPADYTAYNSAKAKVPADLSVYTEESVNALTAALAVDVSGKIAEEQYIIDTQTQAILNAISALRLKPADYTAVYAAVANVPGDLSPYTPESVKILQNAVDGVDYSLDITMQSTVDSYAESITKAIENLEKEGFFARLFRLIKEFFENLFSF